MMKGSRGESGICPTIVILAAMITPAPLRANEASYSPPSTVHLSTAAFPSGITDEKAYATWVADRAKQLIERAAEATEAREVVELRIAAINWVLASQCEPPMSRWLHGIATPEDYQLVNDLTHWGLEELRNVRPVLEKLVAIPEHDEDAADRFDSSIELLEVFAEALSACVIPDSEQNAGAAYRKASTQLSVYLEDDRTEVAAAAKLWQAVLYQKSDRIDRSLRLLTLPSEPAVNRALRYDFFGRVLRCRHLARQQAFAAAWSLLLTLEERSQDWFVTLRSRADAARTTALARLELCDRWAENHDGKLNQRTKNWCEKLTARLQDSYLPPGGTHSVIRLASAAPIIVDFQDFKESDLSGSSVDSEEKTDAKGKPSTTSGDRQETDADSTPKPPDQPPG